MAMVLNRQAHHQFKRTNVGEGQARYDAFGCRVEGGKMGIVFKICRGTETNARLSMLQGGS
jgi:hypothetical protein